ncbi:hypothetical protein NEUTE1DRAFT_135264 [Neurospora tetrasperma FGSC 2508]|uniref:Integral membrane protein n=1 Tax=Neurospora tetrasperma (strain FGSC 2508 / ATCC MYA-4615 / P0657) TaxID=510951 RepID=F8MCK8_NEUT8|nr:uncharacterized protein NEUTE1DRAFT_135264 [Neurospora tetrasperma FGSC 2508]EGO61309.1 hypothetical protein NEUTE1DRAFT_135264 [Neurospora tetrasperma FGSC 2508]EGZ74679.1 hypothetical protein NEUTE2DRAFT_56561 [Neurospora tetrasperma FGSC 2509]
MGNTTSPPKRKDSNHFTGPKHYNAAYTSGAFSFFNPTARYHVLAPPSHNEVEPQVDPATGNKKKPSRASDELSLTGNEAASVLGHRTTNDTTQEAAVASLPQDTDIPTLSADQIGHALEATDSQLSAQSSLQNAANAATVSPERLAGALGTSPSQIGRIVQLGAGNGNGSKTSVNTTQQKQREQDQKDSGVYYVWRSRDNRKGRHAAVVTKPEILRRGKHKGKKESNGGGGNEERGKDNDDGEECDRTSGGWRHRRKLQDEEKGEGIEEEDAREENRGEGPRVTNSWVSTWHGVSKMVTSFPWWDISYDVALTFFLAAISRSINGFFVYLPLSTPESEFKGEKTGAGATRLITCTLVVISSVLLMLEAVNENRADCFGWALEESLAGNADGPRLRSEEQQGKRCTHHHHVRYVILRGSNPRDQRKAVVVPVSVSVPDDQNLHNEKRDDPQAHSDGDASDSNDSDGKGEINSHHNHQNPSRAWKWWPSSDELKSHYLHEIGFLSCILQLIGSIIFWTEGFTGLPIVQNNISTGALAGCYWVPQVVGGFFFGLSAVLTMVEVQDRWYVPAPNLLGWHIGAWCLVGSFGLIVTGALGFVQNAGAQYKYAVGMATFVASWAFLIASVILLFEALNKYPLTVSTAPPSRQPHIRPDAEQETGA